MRKIYSIMLMAAALLISTNAGAWIYVNGSSTPQSNLQTVIDNVAAGDTATLTLDADLELSNVVIIKNGQRICLDLGGNEITDGAGKGCFELVKGTLHVKNGTINHSTAGSGTNVTRSAVTVFGAPWANKTSVWSTLIVDGDAILTTVAAAKQYGITIDAFSAHPALADMVGYTTYIADQPTAPTDKCSVKNSKNKYDSGCAFGVRILIKEGALVYGHQRGINIAGNINSTPDCDGASSLYPYIRVEHGSQVACYSGSATDYMTSGNGGIYAGGYAVMDISGYVHGQTGILVKSGDITLTDATVASDCPQSKTDGDYQGNVAGTGIFITSDAGYAGNVDVTIEGSTTVQGGGYAAIVDVLASNATETNVENIDLKGGSIVGGGEAAIVLTTGTIAETTIYAATITGDIEQKVGDNDPTPVSGTTLSGMVGDPGSTTTSTGASFNEDADYILDVDNTGEKPVINVEPNTAKNVTLNAFGLATYSFVSAEENARRALPSGWTAYITTTGEVDGEGYLKLSPLAENKAIPEETGVILFGPANETQALPLTTAVEAAPIAAANKLVAASAWNTKGANDNIYVLVGNELYKYTGTAMKPNKAFLNLGTATGPNGAPKRIQMVFDETQAVDNVETTIEAVKFMENGQIYIRRGENIYNVQGQIVK